MKVLVIGGGGREHAICWKLSQSRSVDKVYCCPGNAGIAQIAECINVDQHDFKSLLDFVKYEWIDLTVVGPEDPLSRGIVDLFEKEGRRVLGPTKAGAQLESSKVFCKDLLKSHGIPTAEYKVFTSYVHAEEYVRFKGAPIVIKADGLASGKGVFVASTIEEAFDALRIIMKDKAFGAAGDKVIVEECLQGEEASFMAFTDGKTIVPMVSSQDHKRIFDDDKGLNTGGMGAYSPAPILTPELEKTVMDKILEPTVRALRSEGITYKGILYAGLVGHEGHVRHHQRPGVGPSHRFHMVEHLFHGHRQRRVVPGNDHADRIPHQDDIHPGSIHDTGEGVVVGGQHADPASFPLHVNHVRYGDFLSHKPLSNPEKHDTCVHEIILKANQIILHRLLRR